MFKNKYIEDYLKLSPKSRRRVRFTPRSQNFNVTRKRDWTKDELIEYVKENNITSVRELQRARRRGDPSLYYYKKLFGSWFNFKKEVFGLKEKPLPPPTNPEYLISVALTFNLYIIEDYKKMSKKFPEIVPPKCYIFKHFGTWSNFKSIVRRSGFKNLIKDLMDFRRENNKWPTSFECKKMKIDLKALIEFYGSKADMESLLEMYFKTIEVEK